MLDHSFSSPLLSRGIFFTLLLFSQEAAAQNVPLLDFSSPNAIPECARPCQPLYAAEASCTPPQVVAADPSAFQACFCQAPVLQPLKSGVVGVCDAMCPPESLAQLQTWYLDRCGRRVVTTIATVTGGVGTSTSSPPSSTVPGIVTAVASASQQPVTTPPLRSDDARPPGSWWSTHWKWVLMVIIIFLAIVVSSVAGVMLKRRHKRKKNMATAAPIAWGPHQHHTSTWGYAHDAGAPGARSGAARPDQPNMANVVEPAAPRRVRRARPSR